MCLLEWTHLKTCRCHEWPGFPDGTVCTEDSDCATNSWCKGGGVTSIGNCAPCPAHCGTGGNPSGCRACDNDESKMVCGRATTADKLTCAAEVAVKKLEAFLECMGLGAAGCAEHAISTVSDCLDGDCDVTVGWPGCNGEGMTPIGEVAFSKTVGTLLQTNDTKSHKVDVATRKVTEANVSGTNEHSGEVFELPVMATLELAHAESDPSLELIESNTSASQAWQCSRGRGVEAGLSGEIVISGGVSVTLNPRSGSVTASVKTQLDSTATLSITANGHSSCSRARDLATPKRLFSRVFMVGPIPVDVALEVAPREWIDVSTEGTFSATLEAKKTTTLEVQFSFNLNNPDESLRVTPKWTDSPLSITPAITGQVDLSYTHRVGPRFTLKVNAVPLSWDAAVKVQADAALYATADTSGACMSGNFVASAGLDILPGVQFPGFSPGDAAYSACMAAVEAAKLNPKVKAADCLVEGLTGHSLSDACDAMKAEADNALGTAQVPAVKLGLDWLTEPIASINFGAGFCEGSTPQQTLMLTSSVCLEVKHKTAAWASENSWTLEHCRGNVGQYTTNNHLYTEPNCCLKSGSYALKCTDSYGDGWHGGYMMIAGKKYCSSFTTGKTHIEYVTV